MYAPAGGLDHYKTYIGVVTETAAHMKLVDLEEEAEFMPSASSDGGLVAYAILPVKRFEGGGSPWFSPSPDYTESEIEAFQTASGTPIRITQNSWIDLCPDLSPDGFKVVFSRSRDGGRTYSLVLKDLTTGRETYLTEGYVDIDPSFSPDGTKIAFSSNRGGDGKFRIYTLDLSGTSEPTLLEMYEERRSQQIYDFVGRASQAGWRSGAGALPFPGSDTDSRGFAVYRIDAVLEDGSQWQKVLETHPQWVDNGYIQGIYPKQTGTSLNAGFTLQPGTQIKVRVGFLKGAFGTDGVTFKVEFVDQAQTRYTILRHEASYDGHLDLIVKSLDSLSGKTGRFVLTVEAGPSSARDWAIWAEACLETSPTVEIDPEGVNPAWSPDGSKIAFTERRAGAGMPGQPYKGLFRIRVVDVETGESKLVTEYPPPGFDYEMHPSWSPDGSKIVYEGVKVMELDHVGFAYSLWLVDVASGRTDELIDLGQSVPRIPGTPPGFPDYYGDASSPEPYWTSTPTDRLTIVADNPLPLAFTGKSYEYRFDVLGGSPPYTVTVQGLPEGIERSDMVLSGSPSTPGTYSVKFTATDSMGLSAEKTCLLPVGSETIHLGMRWPWPGDEYYVITAAGEPFEFNVTRTLYGGIPPYTVSYTNYPSWASVEGGAISGTPSEEDAEEYTLSFQVTDALGNRYDRSFTLYVLAPNLDSFEDLYPDVPWCAYINETNLIVGGTWMVGLVNEYWFRQGISPLSMVLGIKGLYDEYRLLLEGKENRLTDVAAHVTVSLEIRYEEGSFEIRDRPVVGERGGMLQGYRPVSRSEIFPPDKPLLCRDGRVEGSYSIEVTTRGGQTVSMDGPIVIYRSAYRAVHGFRFQNFQTPWLDPQLAIDYYGEDDFCLEEEVPDWLSLISPAAAVLEVIGGIEGCVPDPIALLFLDGVYTQIGKGSCFGMSLLSLRAREGRLYRYVRSREDEPWRGDPIRAHKAPLDIPSLGGSLQIQWSTYVDGGGSSGSVRTLAKTMQGANLEMDHLKHALDSIIIGDWSDIVAGAAAYMKPGWLIDEWVRNLYEDVESNLEEREASGYADVQPFEDARSYHPLLINMVPSFLDIDKAHTVVAYDMIDTPSAAYILVYDSNSPFDPSKSDDGDTSYIVIDKSSDEWKWNFPGLGSQYGDGYIWAEPYTLVGHEDSPDFPSTDNIGDLLSYVPEGLGVLLAFIVDICGQSAEIDQITGGRGSTLYRPDGSINLDPNTAVVGMVWTAPRLEPVNRSEDRRLYFLVRNDTYAFDVDGLKEGSYGFACTQGHLFILGATNTTTGSRDRFSLDPMGSTIGFSPLSEEKQVSFYIDRYLEGELKEIIVRGFRTSVGGGLSIITDDDNRFIVIKNLGPETSFTVGFRHAIPGAAEEGIYEGIRIGRGETIRITPDWRKPKGKVRVEVDRDSDGKWDATVELAEAETPDERPPQISKITLTPQNLLWTGQVKVSAVVVDEESEVRSVKVFYSTDGGETWRGLEAASAGGDLFSSTIPGQTVGIKVLYYLEAVDAYGNTARSDRGSYRAGLPDWVMASAAGVIILIAIVLAVKRGHTSH